MALLMVLTAAVMHASWNLLLKSSSDRLVAAFIQASIGAGLFLPLMVIRRPLSGEAVPYLLASAAIHLVYGLSLVAAYNRLDLSVAYPLARGLAPPIAALGGVVLLGDDLTRLGVSAIAVISAALVWLALRGGGSSRGLMWPILTGLSISAYTLVDAAGVRAVEESLSYTIWLFVLNAATFGLVAAATRNRRQFSEVWRSEGWRHALGGVLSLGAYSMVLGAARLAPVGLVAAGRETGVVFGALGGWLILKEPFGRRRTIGAVAVSVGIGLLVLSG